jgi:hypothetical protein
VRVGEKTNHHVFPHFTRIEEEMIRTIRCDPHGDFIWVYDVKYRPRMPHGYKVGEKVRVDLHGRDAHITNGVEARLWVAE